MFNLDVISVNIWQILASLANLLILTWILKRFLFKPVKKMLDTRRAAIDADYAQAAAAKEAAEEDRLNYEAAMAAAQQTSDQIISDATRIAEHRSSEIVAEAREKATDIRRQAEADALLDGFFRIGRKLTSDFACMAMTDAMGGCGQLDSKEAASRLFYHRDYREWAEIHGKAMKKHLSF